MYCAAIRIRCVPGIYKYKIYNNVYRAAICYYFLLCAAPRSRLVPAGPLTRQADTAALWRIQTFSLKLGRVIAGLAAYMAQTHRHRPTDFLIESDNNSV